MTVKTVTCDWCGNDVGGDEIVGYIWRSSSDIYDIHVVGDAAASMLDPYGDRGHTPRPWPIPVPVAWATVQALRRRFEAAHLLYVANESDNTCSA
jgi:hypothetical protein